MVVSSEKSNPAQPCVCVDTRVLTVLVQVDKEVEFIHNKTNHLLFGLVVNESAVLNVGGAAVLECVLPFGKILHSLHHGDFTSSTVAEIQAQ